MPRAPLPEVCEGAGIDLVEPGGDGAHLVLGEQRPPQAAKAIAAPWHGAQGEVHLLHAGAEDVVELGKLLRQLSLAGGGTAGSLLREAGAQRHGLEEILQRQHHLAGVGRRFYGAAQGEQGRQGFPPPAVEVGERRLVLGVHDLAVASGMERPGLFPLAAPDAPAVGVVVQPV